VLHSAQAIAIDSRRQVFNFALPPGEGPRRMRPGRSARVLELACRVHQHEPRGLLVLVDNPFFAVSGPDGAVRLEGVPAGRLGVEVLGAGAPRSFDIDLAAGSSLRLSLPIDR
jgi:hypothetical protein